MYVCICNAITESQVQRAIDKGAADLWDLQRELGVAAGCGSCRETASAILHRNRQHAATTPSEPRLYRPNIA